MSRWLPRLVTVFLAVLLAASLVFWWLKIAAGPTAPPAPTLVRENTTAPPRELTALFPQVQVSADSNFKLIGVIAEASGAGRALISVSEAPAKPYATGAELSPGVKVQRIEKRSVVLDRSGAQSSLSLPAVKIATMSPLPLPPSGAMATLPPAMIPAQPQEAPQPGQPPNQIPDAQQVAPPPNVLRQRPQGDGRMKAPPAGPTTN